MMTPEEQAKHLVSVFGKIGAINCISIVLDEINKNFSQERADYWLDVRLIVVRL